MVLMVSGRESCRGPEYRGGAMSKDNLIVELSIISEALHQTVNELEGDQEKTCWGKACVAVDTLINMVKQREEKDWN